MPNSEKRSFGQEFAAWVQAIGIIVAALVGFYEFVYKEIMVPKSAPVNITLDLQLKKISIGNLKNKHLVPIEIKVSAKNPSSREVYLLSSTWCAWGRKIVPFRESQSFIDTVITSETNYLVQRYCNLSEGRIVAFGNLFLDNALKPNEVTTTTLLVHLPPDKYDVFEIWAEVPTVNKKDVITKKWTLNEEKQKLDSKIYRLSKSGKGEKVEEEIKKDRDGHYLDRDARYLDEKLALQEAISSSMICLWE